MHACIALFMLFLSVSWNVAFYSAVGYADVDIFDFSVLVFWFATCEKFCRFLFLWCGLYVCRWVCGVGAARRVVNTHASRSFFPAAVHL